MTDTTFIPPETEAKLADILIEGGLVGTRENLDEINDVFEGLMEFPDTMTAKLLEFIQDDEDHQDELYQECDAIIQDSKLIEADDDEMREAMVECMNKSIDDLTNALEVIFFQRGVTA